MRSPEVSLSSLDVVIAEEPALPKARHQQRWQSGTDRHNMRPLATGGNLPVRPKVFDSLRPRQRSLQICMVSTARYGRCGENAVIMTQIRHFVPCPPT
nr:MAG TPA: hypothetical protein [Caudoviricetes sp.]